MKKANIFTVPFRRKKEGRTNYRKRLKMLLSSKPRLVVRRSLNNIYAQIIEYQPKGDKIILSANSIELERYGWKCNCGNVPSAYLVGLLIGRKAKDNGVKEAILDIGLHKPVNGSRIYALLKGALDGGLNVPCSADVLPKEERVTGLHIMNYASALSKNHDDYKKRFSGYLKSSININELNRYFENAKLKILGVT